MSLQVSQRVGRPRGRTAPQRVVLRGTWGGQDAPWRRCISDPALWAAAAGVLAARERSALIPRALPPLRQRPLPAVETTPAPSFDGELGLLMATPVNPRDWLSAK